MTIIAGPCVIESPELLREVAGELARIKRELNVEIYFKASFDKANRTSLSSFRGPGIEEGIAMLRGHSRRIWPAHYYRLSYPRTDCWIRTPRGYHTDSRLPVSSDGHVD